MPFEAAVFSKPFFDPQSLLIAEVNGEPAGFVQTAFGPNSDETGIDPARGVLAGLIVRPEYRGHGIGSQLLAQAEGFLRSQGSQKIVAGPAGSLATYFFGIYGGSAVSGFLQCHEHLSSFLTNRGYSPRQSTSVFQRSLADPVVLPDSRFVSIRRRFNAQWDPCPQFRSWWRECAIGWLDPMAFQLEEKATQQQAARLLTWEISRHPDGSAPPTIGLVDLHVASEFRQKGLAKFLILQTLRSLKDQLCGKVEVHLSDSHVYSQRLFSSLGFEIVDRATSFEKELTPV